MIPYSQKGPNALPIWYNHALWTQCSQPAGRGCGPSWVSAPAWPGHEPARDQKARAYTIYFRTRAISPVRLESAWAHAQAYKPGERGFNLDRLDRSVWPGLSCIAWRLAQATTYSARAGPGCPSQHGPSPAGQASGDLWYPLSIVRYVRPLVARLSHSLRSLPGLWCTGKVCRMPPGAVMLGRIIRFPIYTAPLAPPPLPFHSAVPLDPHPPLRLRFYTDRKSVV